MGSSRSEIGAWTGCIWLRMWTCDGLLWKRWDNRAEEYLHCCVSLALLLSSAPLYSHYPYRGWLSGHDSLSTRFAGEKNRILGCPAHVLRNPSLYYNGEEIKWKIYKVVQIWPGQTVSCLHTNRPGHIWTTLYLIVTGVNALKAYRCENNI
jgi:hypothetical protein